MEIDGGNSCLNENLPSEGSKNVNEGSNSIDKEVCDSVFVNHGMSSLRSFKVSFPRP